MSPHSRRDFLRNAGTTALLAVVFDPFKRVLASFINQEKLPPWAELVEFARWCPTVHNLQAHKIKIISETEADLYYEPARLLPMGDPDSVFVTVALGIFIEHLSIASSPYGMKVEIIQVFDPVMAKATKETLFARLELVPDPVKEVLDRKLILKRRTSRLHYDGESLKQDTLNKIKEQAAQLDHEFFSSSAKEDVDFVIGLNQQTLFEDLESKPVRDELDRLFRYNKKEAETHKDGLWAKCMGFSGALMKSVFHHHERWEKGLRKRLLAKRYKTSFKGTGTICWFAGSFKDTHDWLQAGRMLARSWLLITGEKAYIHPFGSLITNEKAYKKINEKLAHPDCDKKIWMIFRAGYSNEPTRSYRLSTEEILIQ